MTAGSSFPFESSDDPVVELFKLGVDRNVVRDIMAKSHEERLLTLEGMLVLIQRLHSPASATGTEGVPRPVTTQFRALLTTLSANEVSFIIVGGVAAVIHGSSRVTYDMDIVYERTPENLRRMVAALTPVHPYLRGAVPGLPFRLGEETLRRGLNFAFATSRGGLDLLGGLAGIGSYPTVSTHTVEVNMFGASYRVVDLDTLIASKRATGRTKDLEAIAELETIRDEHRIASASGER